jgi:hypothetical protein
MNLPGAVILVVLIIVVLGASRWVALLGMMAGVMFLTEGQPIQVIGFNLFSLRFLELAGFIRVMARHEFSFRQMNRIDGALLLLYGYTTVVFLFRSTEGVAYQIGVAMDAFLCYFTFRGLITGIEDVYWFLRAFIVLLVPYTLLVVFESMTDHNLFTLVGGVEGGSHWLREGRPRCFGSFRQPDTLGMFSASFLPMYIGLACIAEERKRAIIGIGLCLILAWAANSGGAVSGVAAGLVCWGFWRFRTEMRKVRWGIVSVLLLLALAMKAPIWYIFQRASAISGGDGWHRSYLIDVSYRHLSQWWLAGMPLSETTDWFPYNLSSTGAADITNQYVAFGLAAGVVSIALFIFLLTRAFSDLGKTLAAIRSYTGQTPDAEFLLWGLGAMLTVHIVNWFGIAYFDQMYAIWFMQLAIVSGLSYHFLNYQAPVHVDETANETSNMRSSQHEIIEISMGLSR